MVNEFSSLTKFFYSEVNKKSFSCFYNDSHLKLLQLNHAKQAGLSICNTLITNNKSSIKNYYKESNTITKAIEDNIGTEHNDRLIVQRVQRLDYDKMEESFFPSLFQNEIDKLYELRVFYLDGMCYSICFKSSSNNVDMRDNYSISEYEPYKFPNEIEDKIIKFMDKMKLVSGSLDFIKSTDGTYYFLEVNPNGQYEWVSRYGGYNLHQKIAYFLSSKNREI
jgi:glutathione synthase/RimK-type ligase-like ATP-grasp enzyme